MPLEDIMGKWHQNLAYSEDEDPPATVDDLMNPDSYEEEAYMPELPAYRDFISKAPAYEWLLASLRREILLSPVEPNSMEAIRRKIIHYLPSSHKVSRKKSAEAYKITFEIDWDPLVFIKEQEYRVEPDEEGCSGTDLCPIPVSDVAISWRAYYSTD
jgi:hypothetical protein